MGWSLNQSTTVEGSQMIYIKEILIGGLFTFIGLMVWHGLKELYFYARRRNVK